MPSDDPSREALPPSGPQQPQSEQQQLGPTDDEFADIPFAVPVEAAKTDSTPFAEVVEPDAASAIPFAQLVEPASTSAAIPLVRPADLETVATVRPTPKPPHPGFWWSALWSFVFTVLINGVILVVMVGMFGAHIALADNPREYTTKLRSRTFRESVEYDKLLASVIGPAMLLGELLSVTFALTMIRLIVGKDWKRLLALRRPGLLYVVLVLLGFPGLLHLSGGVELLAKYVSLPTFHSQDDFPKLFAQWPWWFGVLVIGLGPGLGEELWCRGFLGRGLVARYGPMLGVVFTSFFFGCMHADPPLVVTTAVMGLWLHFTYLMTRSLLVPMLLHFLNNSLAFLGVLFAKLEAAAEVPADTPLLVQLAQRAVVPLQPLLDPTEKTRPEVYVAGVLSLLAVGWALYQSRARLVGLADSEQPTWHPDFPSVAYPPPGSATTVVHARPGWLASCLMLVALAFFGVLAYHPEWLPRFGS